jgi:hypothetical protein
VAVGRGAGIKVCVTHGVLQQVSSGGWLSDDIVNCELARLHLQRGLLVGPAGAGAGAGGGGGGPLRLSLQRALKRRGACAAPGRRRCSACGWPTPSSSRA